MAEQKHFDSPVYNYPEAQTVFSGLKSPRTWDAVLGNKISAAFRYRQWFWIVWIINIILILAMVLAISGNWVRLCAVDTLSNGFVLNYGTLPNIYLKSVHNIPVSELQNIQNLKKAKDQK